jgi:hypothetical protein
MLPILLGADVDDMPMIEALATMVNAQLEAVFQGHDARTAEFARET